jgi:DNA-binding YbaB/EbfC family protein
MFDKMKQLMEMQKKMQEVKRELEQTNFEISSPDGLIKIVMNGAQEVKDIIIKEEFQATDKIHLEKALKDTYNRAIRHSHDIAAQKMKNITGFNIPGLT